MMRRLVSGIALAALVIGCGGHSAVKTEKIRTIDIAPMGYTIQVGAFANMDNAVRLTATLHHSGLDAYHFLHDSGLYKVRFGNYANLQAARRQAETLVNAGTIDVYYIVAPEDYIEPSGQPHGILSLRDSIVKTANKYVGIPYQWGGESPETGFDCSGFAMVVYQLNGLDLPRSSHQQWRIGQPVKRSQLMKGDLVFFATSNGSRVSHVGIYTGENRFLHAPGSGRKIRSSSLSETYYKIRYVGARTYL